jgi:type I restriction enzyme M protein
VVSPSNHEPAAISENQSPALSLSLLTSAAMSNLSPVIKSIQDIMRQDSGVDGDAQRISQLTWLLFLKMFDAQEEELEVTRDHYKSPIPEELRWRNWAADAEGLTGDKLLEHVNGKLFPQLKALPGDAERNPRGYVVRSVFEDAFNYMKSGQLLRQIINKLNAINFHRQADRHQFNDLYEKILRDLQAAGNAGEFYTPRAVTQFMVDIVNPRLGETVLDPACGTGGFLVCALEHLRQQVKNEQDQATLQTSVRGVEKKQLPHMLCVTNLMLHGVEVPSLIAHDNTLTRPLRDYGAADRVDVIITNPPFGGVEEPGTENNFPADVRTKETADLFLVLIKHLLKPGGRGALVLPDGTLFGEGVKTRIKEQLLAECKLHTIVRLPNGVFAPYTGIKTNLLFFTKGQPTTDVWYYEHPYPAGVKTYNKTKPIRIEEFDAEKAWWGTEVDGFASRVESERAWKVSIEQIRAANYNLDQKNPHIGEVEDHDPEHLLADYQRLQAEAQALRDELKAILAESLTSSLSQGDRSVRANPSVRGDPELRRRIEP